MNKKYLINSGQSEINDDIKDFCSKISNINSIDDLTSDMVIATE